MFRRLVFEDSAALFTLAAFITAVSIYFTIGWRALRMKPPQVTRFENLPFETATPAAVAVGGASGLGSRRPGDFSVARDASIVRTNHESGSHEADSVTST